MGESWANPPVAEAEPRSGVATVDLHIERDPTVGVRDGLERALRAAIREGRLAPGGRLPSSRVLATELSIARNTVAAAYDQLVAEGFLVARTGSGTAVAEFAQAQSTAAHTSPAAKSPRYDLRPGKPDVSSFPVTAWLRAMRRALSVAPWSSYGYGDPRGSIELRVALAGYLGRARGVLAQPEQIIITTGCVQALALMTAGANAVAMEDPGLDWHRELVRRQGAKIVPLPVDERGARPDGLPRVDMVVVTPANQYPTGVPLHPERRHALAELARTQDLLIVEDDYDGEFRYDRQPVGAMQGMTPDHVVYIGTAAKTLAPALRLGWMVLPAHLVDRIADAKRHMDLHSEMLSQLAMAELITSHGFDRHIRARRLHYRKRRDLLIKRLSMHKVTGIAAGLHALIEVEDERAVLAAASERGLALGSLSKHRQRPAETQGIIVGYGTPPDHLYGASIDVLGRVLRAVG